MTRLGILTLSEFISQTLANMSRKGPGVTAREQVSQAWRSVEEKNKIKNDYLTLSLPTWSAGAGILPSCWHQWKEKCPSQELHPSFVATKQHHSLETTRPSSMVGVCETKHQLNKMTNTLTGKVFNCVFRSELHSTLISPQEYCTIKL